MQPVKQLFNAVPTLLSRYDISAAVFIDATGDGRLGVEAGAGFVFGREGRDAYNESLAEGPDELTQVYPLLQFNPSPWAIQAPFRKGLGLGEPRRGYLPFSY